MASLCESTPLSESTSVPTISSASSNQSQIVLLKQRLETLKLQLRQRELEIEREKFAREDDALDQQKTHAEMKHLQVEVAKKTRANYEKLWNYTDAANQRVEIQTKAEMLRAICDDMLEWMKNSEEEERGRTESLQTLYRKNMRELTDKCTVLKAQNGVLNQKLISAQTTLTGSKNEVKYLQWENSTLKEERENNGKTVRELQKSLSTVRESKTLLEAELRQTKTSHVNNVEQELHCVLQRSKTQLARLKRVHDDREKEYGITLARLQNEVEYLKSETQRKENESNRLTELLDKLTKDNKKLFDMNLRQRKDYDFETMTLRKTLADLEFRLVETKKEKDQIKANIRGGLRSAEHEKDLENCQRIISDLKQQVLALSDPRRVPGTCRDVARKSVESAELRRKMRELERECAEEREHRENATFLVEELTNDMRLMISTMKAHGL